MSRKMTEFLECGVAVLVVAACVFMAGWRCSYRYHLDPDPPKHFHAFSQWSNPVHMWNSDWKDAWVQTRQCTNCGLAEVRNAN